MTPHVLDQLPLWVEGDLGASDLAAVDHHLAQCQTCHAAAEDLRTSQRLLRASLASPFADADALRLRQRVMDQVRMEARPRPVRHLALRPALLAACAASLLIGVLTWRQGPGHPIPPALPLAPAPPMATMPPEKFASPSLLATRETLPQRAAHPRPAAKPEAESPPLGEPARIEFQTADPTIRIIWLAQAKDLSEFHASLPEEP